MLFLRQISVGVIYGMVYVFICFRTANCRRVIKENGHAVLTVGFRVWTGRYW